MNREMRQYRSVKAVLLGFGLVVFLGLLTASWRLWPALSTSLQATKLGCGCAQVVIPPSPWLSLTAWLTISLTAWVIGRFVLAVYQQVNRSAGLARSFAALGRRTIYHQRLRLHFQLVDSPETLAVTLGHWRPQIYLSAALLRRLGGSELESVLRHEEHHRRVRDPLIMALIVGLRQTFGWLPMIRNWAIASFSLRELTADAAATNNYRATDGLAGAFLKISEAQWPAAISAFSPNTDRLNKLLDSRWRPRFKLWRWTYGLTFGVLLLTAFGLVRVGHARVTTVNQEAQQLCRQTRMMCRFEGRVPPTPTTVCLDGQCASVNRPWTPAYVFSLRS